MSGEKYKRERPFRVGIRLNESEMKKLDQDAKQNSVTIAQLLRESYLKRSPTTILMTVVQYEKFIAELNRIGNNINQLARKANIGEVVLDKNFISVNERLQQLEMFIRRLSGIR